MDSYEHNKDFLTASLKGTVQVNIYDEEGKLKRVHTAENVITTNGVNRLVDMLIDGYNQNYPKATVDWLSTDQTSTLSDKLDFNGGKDGEIFGVNVINWSGRSKSTFARNGFQNSSYLTNVTSMFNNNPTKYTRWYNGYQENQYWSPGGETSGYICDLGVTDVVNESFTSDSVGVWKNVANKNLYYTGMIVKSNDLLITYTNNVHYQWETGDGDNYGRIKILSGGPASTALKISYVWYDVPQVPIVGFGIQAGGNGGWGYRTFFHAWRWSLNQGASRTRPFLPNYSGNPHRPGWQTYYWDRPWYPTWHASTAEPHTYFQHNLPWAVKNPVQLAWFGNHTDTEKWIYDFQLLGMKMPKLGIHAIGLGTGTGSPSEGDSGLFSLSLKKVTERKTENGTAGMKMTAYLDYNEANGTTFREAGLFHSTNDSVYFKTDSYWSGSTADGYSGEHSDYISGTNKILKLSSIEASDCDALSTHAMFDTPWSKTSSERAEIVYNLSIYWN